MALPTIKINSSGSDTQASGAGPSTAVFGTAGATHSNTTINISDAVNLGGVATDGSAVLWLQPSSGRQFSKITGISGSSGAWVVTVASAYANSQSGVSWAIGGKRQTIAGSSRLFVDWDLGWTIDIQTGETISSGITITCPSPDGTTAPPTITSTTFTTWGTQPLIQTATNSLVMFNVSTNGCVIKNLSFKSTAATPATGFQSTSGNATNISWVNCIFDGFLMAIDGANAIGFVYFESTVDGCEIKNCTQTSSSAKSAVTLANTSNHWGIIRNSYLHDNKAAFYNTGGARTVVQNCVFANNADATPIQVGSDGFVFANNTIYNCGSGTSGAALTIGGSAVGNEVIENNIFYGCSGYGLDIPSGRSGGTLINRNNAFGGNNGGGTGGNVLHTATTGDGAITLTSSPFMSTGTPDYGLNSDAGGGTLCKQVAAGVPNASANTAGDIGAIPSGGGGSGSSGATAYAY